MSARTTRLTNKTKTSEMEEKTVEHRSGGAKSVAERETEISKLEKLSDFVSTPPPLPPRSRPSSPLCNGERAKTREESGKRSRYVNALVN